jgi:ferrous iron transport protein A
MTAGEQGTVFEIRGGGSVKRRLEAIGIRPGVTIEKLTGSPFGGPLVVRIGHTRLALGYGIASKVIVAEQKAAAP